MTKRSPLLNLSIITFVLALICMAAAADIFAQDNQEPELPAPLATLSAEGAQVRYLGNHNDIDGWITVRNGREQYFYKPEGSDTLMMGLLFDLDGTLVTVRQVKALQDQGDDVLGSLAINDLDLTPENNQSLNEFKTPAQQLYADISESNWVALGQPTAPYIYTFVDPQCPHCHNFTKDLKEDYIQSGKLQVRIVPVGLTPERKAQAAFLLAAPNPQDRWFRAVEGDKEALPVSENINQQGVERNLAIMQSWKLDVTPLTVYQSASGDIKIIQGRPADPAVILNDLNGEG